MKYTTFSSHSWLWKILLVCRLSRISMSANRTPIYSLIHLHNMLFKYCKATCNNQLGTFPFFHMFFLYFVVYESHAYWCRSSASIIRNKVFVAFFFFFSLQKKFSCSVELPFCADDFTVMVIMELYCVCENMCVCPWADCFPLRLNVAEFITLSRFPRVSAQMNFFPFAISFPPLFVEYSFTLHRHCLLRFNKQHILLL